MLTTDQVYKYSLTGVMARGSGIRRDLRVDLIETYANYHSLNFRTYLGQNGDCYDRYLIRMYEMGESLIIINQALKKFSTEKKITRIKIRRPLKPRRILRIVDKKSKSFEHKSKLYNNMESLIKHFDYFSNNLTLNANKVYRAIESPKGEFGVTIIADNSNKPYRCKVRSPAYFHLQSLKPLLLGHGLVDLAAIIGTIDIVFGEIDR